MEMKPLVVFLHGYNAKDPSSMWDQHEAAFKNEGFECRSATYGKTGLLSTAFSNPHLAMLLLSSLRMLNRRVIMVGHSNGCAIIYRMLSIDAQDFVERATPKTIVEAVFLSAALDKDAHNRYFPAAFQPPRIVNCHTRRDSVLRFIRWVPGIRWGNMGAVGATPEKWPFQNRDFTQEVKGHDGWFTPAAVAYFHRRIIVPLSVRWRA